MEDLSPFAQRVLSDWETRLLSASQTNLLDTPNYYARSPRSTLLTSSTPSSISFGTGTQLFSAICAQIRRHVRRELILVTCFWADSPSSRDLAATLLHLSRRGIAQGRRICVRIGFSSCSLAQKLFHTASLEGKVWGPETWTRTFGLPVPGELGGLDLEVKSIFVHPFSVMHPKFVLLDRETACMPSANVSWEEWFEGCIWFRGRAVKGLLEFWKEFWNGGQELGFDHGDIDGQDGVVYEEERTSILRPLQTAQLEEREIQTLLLPSPHHRNPHFRPLMGAVSSPPTPLNVFLLVLISKAQRSIVLQSPNLTAAPVQVALLDALRRGVDVQITTSSRLMILEQILTAGQTTECAVASLRASYKKLAASSKSVDPELGLVKVGRLRIRWFLPIVSEHEPVKSHLKLAAIDQEVLVLGSGNLDRASWYTSQELGIAFFGPEIVEEAMKCLELVMSSRVKE